MSSFHQENLGVGSNEVVPDLLENQPIFRVLEIGCGWNLANMTGGELFNSGAVSYTGVDVPEGLNTARSREAMARGEIIIADCVALPFPDESYDLVMMRSVFGQFVKGRVGLLNNVLWFGLMEAFRVLKKDGTIVIAEENTPLDAEAVEFRLLATGFRPTVFEYMSKDNLDKEGPSSPWRKLRQQYYGDKPLQTSKWTGVGASKSPPYMLIAKKPPEYKEVTETLTVTLDGKKKPVTREYRHGAPIAAVQLAPDYWDDDSYK